MAAMSYLLEGTVSDHDRQRAEARAWEPATGRLFDQVELARGARCLDARCGPGETMRLMAQRVGPTGEVTGIDVDPAVGEHAIEILHAAGHRHCTFAFVDLATDDAIPGAPFDLVYARRLLMHVADPVAVVRRLWGVVARGGHLVIQDYDARTIAVAPPLKPVSEFRRVFIETLTATGRRADFGHHLPLLLARAGIGNPDGTDVAGRLESLSNLGPQFADMYRAMLPAAESLGITSAEHGGRDLNELARDVARHPDHFALSPLLIGVWKRKVHA
jgi:ubiquinone/menaquinone biosynthesis C-methylase UbiE